MVLWCSECGGHLYNKDTILCVSVVLWCFEYEDTSTIRTPFCVPVWCCGVLNVEVISHNEDTILCGNVVYWVMSELRKPLYVVTVHSVEIHKCIQLRLKQGIPDVCRAPLENMQIQIMCVFHPLIPLKMNHLLIRMLWTWCHNSDLLFLEILHE